MIRLLFILISFPVIGWAQHAVSVDTILMGSSFSFTAVANEEKKAQKAVDDAVAQVAQLEALISSWRSDSETSIINRYAGQRPVKVSLELYQLIGRCKRISKLSNGYFDISFAGLNGLWSFSGDQVTIPDQREIDGKLALVNYQNIEMNPDDTTVFLTQKGMRIGFGAIGKGLAANKAKKVMQDQGIQSGVVNAGGDLIAWGTKPDGSSWNVGIQDPDNKNGVLMWIPAINQAIVTSGNYEKYIDLNGKRYCHIIDPKTGWPVLNMRSVTVICADAELADALSTTTFVLGAEAGMDMINQIAGVEAIIVDENDEIHFSQNINSNYGNSEN